MYFVDFYQHWVKNTYAEYVQSNPKSLDVEKALGLFYAYATKKISDMKKAPDDEETKKEKKRKRVAKKYEKKAQSRMSNSKNSAKKAKMSSRSDSPSDKLHDDSENSDIEQKNTSKDGIHEEQVSSEEFEKQDENDKKTGVEKDKYTENVTAETLESEYSDADKSDTEIDPLLINNTEFLGSSPVVSDTD